MKTSTYPVLDNRPIDQWKVAELKEELKRRKLTTKGLKEDLVKRLDEAIRNETEAAAQELDCGVEDPQSKIVTEATEPVQIVDGTSDPVAQSRTTTLETAADDTTDCGDIRSGKLNSNLDQVGFDGDVAPQGEDNVQEKERIGDPKGDEVPVNDMPVGLDSSVCEHSPSEILLAVQRSQISEMERENRDSRDEQDFDDLALCMQGPLHDEMEGNRDSKAKTDSDEVKPSHVDVKLNLSDASNQVSEVSPSLGFPVKSDSITTDSVSINETNDLKDNIIADNVKLEIDVKPEMMVQSSSCDLVPDAGKSHPMDAEEPHENQVSVEEINNNVTDADISKKNYTADLGSSEKLNLDRSSGDDSMEEDALESKQIESTYNSNEVGDRREKNEMPRMKEENPVDVMVDDLIEDKKDVHVENENGVAASAEKRKLSDQEANPNDEPSKRQRRWKSERLKVMEPKSLNLSPSTTPKDDVLKPTLKRNFSLSKSIAGNDGPEERVVPPPTRSPTNSLRIDHFLRPFTLKAVQELLGKTGTATGFWMDHIKTHCYVTYSSEQEAINTRNAVYNLQWPPNGGRLLVAEFVEPEEVKMRAEAPPQLPAAPVNVGPSGPTPPTSVPQPPPRQATLRQQQLPTPTLPPPPPLPNPPPTRERVLPPQPPLPEKVDPPIVTLDDLFKKTKATPRIYYLPLSEEQISAKLQARSRNTKQ